MDSEGSLILIDSNVDAVDCPLHHMQQEAEADPAMFCQHIFYKDFAEFEKKAPPWINRQKAKRLEKTTLPADFKRDILGQRSDALNALFTSEIIELCKSDYQVPVADLKALTNGRAYKVGAGLDRSKSIFTQTMEHFLGCHQNAFDWFGAVPGKIMVDNLKSAVLKRIIGKDPVFNPKYLDFANHHGFTIAPCAVGKGNEKGRVESGVGYVKKNFLAGLEIPNFNALNPAVIHWLDTVANVRIHGETGKRPVDRLPRERQCMTQLPPYPYDIATIEQVRASRQFRVAVDGNRYSVPAEYAGALLTLKTYPDRLCIYHQQKLIARHVRSYDRKKDFELPDHPKALLAQRRKARDQKIFMRFLSLSDKADEYYRQLEQRRMNPVHHIRQIVALSEIYGEQSVQRAIEDAFVFQAFSCEYIANLLEQRTRKIAQPAALHLTRRQDLLEITVEKPDMEIYNKSLKKSEEKS